MVKLLDLEEMERRHTKGEDPFDLAIEKWVRIREYLLEKSGPGPFSGSVPLRLDQNHLLSGL